MAGKSALLLSAAALALNANAASAWQRIPVLHGETAPHYAHSAISGTPSGAQTLYDQNADDKGLYVMSDSFYGFESYDNQAADDFVVPAGHTWKIKQVDVTGQYFDGSGPADWVNLWIYKNKQGMPGKPVGECDFLQPARDDFGSYTLELPRECWFRLKGGTAGTRYWLAVQAGVNPTVQGQGKWGWEVSGVQHGKKAMWRNAGGFGFCPTWDTTENCFGADYGPDLMFALKGTSK